MMGSYKFFASLAIVVLFIAYGAWLRKERAQGRGASFFHKDITLVVVAVGLVVWGVYMIYEITQR
jgi:uncharacterized membrane protein YidH (DUF202 family)